MVEIKSHYNWIFPFSLSSLTVALLLLWTFCSIVVDVGWLGEIKYSVEIFNHQNFPIISSKIIFFFTLTFTYSQSRATCAYFMCFMLTGLITLKIVLFSFFFPPKRATT